MTKNNNKERRAFGNGFFSVFFALLLFFSLILANSFAQAAFSQTINYQGKLSDGAGAAVADGDYNMRFRLCPDSNCSSSIYQEEWINSDKVTVTDGLFSVLVGSISSLGSVDFNQDLYLEVSVGGTGAPSWEILTPRKRLGAVPNSFNAQKFDGLSTSSVAVLGRDNVFSASNTFSGNLFATDLSVSNSLTVPEITLNGVTRTSWPGGGSGTDVNWTLNPLTDVLSPSTSTSGILVNGDSAFLGKLNIGTTTALSDLSVNYSRNNNIGGLVVGNSNSGTSATSELKMYNNLGQVGALFAASSNYNTYGGGSYKGALGIVSLPGRNLVLGNMGDDSIIFGRNGMGSSSVSMSISSSTVKIGTTTGNYSLNVAGSDGVLQLLDSNSRAAIRATVSSTLIGNVLMFSGLLDTEAAVGANLPGLIFEDGIYVYDNTNSGLGSRLGFISNDFSSSGYLSLIDSSLVFSGVDNYIWSNNSDDSPFIEFDASNKLLQMVDADLYSPNIYFATTTSGGLIPSIKATSSGTGMLFSGAQNFSFLDVINDTFISIDAATRTINILKDGSLSLAGGYLNVGAAPLGATFGGGYLNVQNGLVVGGNATTSGYMNIGGARPAGAMLSPGYLNVQNGLVVGGNATTSGYMNIGINPPAGSNFSDGNLNVQNNLVVGGSLTVANQFNINGSLSIGSSTIYSDLVAADPDLLLPSVTTLSLGMKVSGNYLYMVFQSPTSTDLLRIIDISNPDVPKIIGGQSLSISDFGTGVRGFDVAGNYAYLGFEAELLGDNFKVIDVSNPSNPRVVGGYKTSPTLTIRSIKVVGKYAYIVLYNQFATTNAVQILDISDPRNIRRVSNDIAGMIGELRAIEVAGNYAYVASYSDAASSTFRIIDISDPVNPVQVGGNGLNVGGWSRKVVVRGRYAYLINDAFGLPTDSGNAANESFKIIDVSDPSNPVIVGGTNLDFAYTNTSGINDIVVDDHYAYVTDRPGAQLRIIDISSSTNPVFAYTSPGYQGSNGPPWPLAISGDRLFVGFGGQSMNSSSTGILKIFRLNGIYSPALRTGSIYTSNINLQGDFVSQGVIKGYSLNLGSGGFMSNGSLSVNATSTASFFGGQLMVATSTYISSSSKLIVGGAILSTDLLGGPTTLSTDANGNIIRTPSDMRLKENIELIEGALPGVLALNPVYYNWKDKSRFGEQREMGLLAQEVQAIFPEVVSAGSEYLSVNYQALVPVLISAIKDQQQQISAIAEGKELLPVNSSPYGVASLQANKLTVKESASFYGTITVIGEAGFATKVTFSDHVYFDGDSAGTAKIAANATSTEVIFSKPYETIPIVTITPKKKMSGVSWWVENESVSGFTIAIDPSSGEEWEFNWQAVAISGSKQAKPAAEDLSEEPENPGEVVPEPSLQPENATGTANNLIIDNSALLPENEPQEPNLAPEDASGPSPQGSEQPLEAPETQVSQNEPIEE